MTAQELYKMLLDDLVWPDLKVRGFKRSGSTFGLRGAGVWGVINFQKSQWNSVDLVSFTINIAVRSDVLAVHEGCAWGPAPSDRKVPAEGYGQWRRRIGDLLPAQQDTWWEIQSGDSIPVGPEVRGAVLEYAVPALRSRGTDEALLQAGEIGLFEQAVLAREHRGETEFRRLAAELMRTARDDSSYDKYRLALERMGYSGASAD